MSTGQSSGDVSKAGTSGPHAPAQSGQGGTAQTAGDLIPSAAPGVTRDDIYLGVGYSPSAKAAYGALGAANAAPSYDSRAVIDATIAYANRHGGFGGRQLKPIYYAYDANSDINTQDQAACAYWTQDHKVFAVLASRDILRECAEKSHALAIGTGGDSSNTYDKFAHYLAVDSIRLDRLGVVTVKGLATQRYFAGKLGIIAWDNPDYRLAVTKGYLPSLRDLGVTPATPPVYVAVPGQLTELSATSAAVQSAVTKFRSLGVDHVIIVDGPAGVFSGDGLTGSFMNQAESQNYRPRYGGNIYNFPGFAANPPDQMNQALYVDQTDTDTKNDIGWHSNRAREKCYAIQAKAGLPVSSAHSNDEAVAAVSCDFTFLLQQVINALTDLSAESFIASYQSLGTSFASSVVFGTHLEPGRRDGGAFVRLTTYLSSCRCVEYLSRPYDAS